MLYRVQQRSPGSPLAEKALRSDSAIDNSASSEQTARKVADLLRQWGVQ